MLQKREGQKIHAAWVDFYGCRLGCFFWRYDMWGIYLVPTLYRISKEWYKYEWYKNDINLNVENKFHHKYVNDCDECAVIFLFMFQYFKRFLSLLANALCWLLDGYEKLTHGMSSFIKL